MDLTASIVPKSDQLNADDLMTGPVTVTIESVSAGNAEQPVDVHIVEFPGRAYRPSKSMRRVMVSAWGKESAVYTGHRMTLYRDPEVKFGGDKVGGIKISHLSHIPKPMPIALTETRGKRKVHTVDPLPDEAPTKPTRKAAESAEPSAAEVAACADRGALRAMWAKSGDERRAQITARVAELDAGPGPSDVDWDAMGARAGDLA